MKGSAEQSRAYSLSDGDIRRLLGNDIKILVYSDLTDYNNPLSLFDGKGRCILLYQTEDATTGHWVCLLNHKDRVEFFDPYGDKPETQKKYMNPMLKKSEGLQRPLLVDLLKKLGKPITYNTHAFQKTRDDVATCGRHAVVRCYYAPYSLDKYKKIVEKSGLAPDDFVLGITYDKLRK